MPSFVPHIVVPTLLAMAFFPMAKKRILMWAPLAWVPDLDYFFAVQFHRALLSNVWIPLYFAALLVFMWRRCAPESRFWEYAWRPGAPGAVLLVVYFFSTHILMDSFAGGVLLFWPLSDTNFYWFFAIIVDTATNTPTTYAEGGTEQGVPEVSSTYEWLSPVDTAVMALLLTAWLCWLGYLGWKRFSIQKE